MLPKDIKYHLALVFAYIIWSAAGPIIKLTLNEVPPAIFLLLRMVIVCVIVLPFTLYSLQKEKIHPHDLFHILLLSFFAQSTLIFVFVGLDMTSVIEASLITILGPVLSVIAGYYLFKEKVSTYTKIGIFVAGIGSILVAFEPLLLGNHNAAGLENRMLGNFFVFLNVIAFVLYVIWSKIAMKIEKVKFIKPMKKAYSPILLTNLSFFVGLISFVPFALYERFFTLRGASFEPYQLDFNSILGILFMAIFSSIVAYILFEWALCKVDVKATGIYSYLQPLFTIPFAYILLKELPGPIAVLSYVIIFIGVIIAEYKKS